MPPPLLQLATESEYRVRFHEIYCREPRVTHDGIPVHFYAGQFDHAFFESANRRAKDKSLFSSRRAERLEWIGLTLSDPSAEQYVGWNSAEGRQDPGSRVSLIYQNYVVVIRLVVQKQRAIFTTAFPAEDRTLEKIRSNPRWAGVWTP